MQIGQVVFSKCGRDKDRAFVVLSVEGEYVFLADGQLRPLNKPKKKKVKHTQPTNTVLVLEKQGLATMGGITDADIRKWLLPFRVSMDRVNEEVSNCLKTT
ncbi:MAG: KOW domain-containing RNA-binding protein [Defluviitaleaceae bacterium]|nr:KOW domain-containing RNA-binding protein [Defluviitaleaceae bacterium]